MSYRLCRRRKVEVPFRELAKRVRPKDHIAEHWHCCQQSAFHAPNEFQSNWKTYIPKISHKVTGPFDQRRGQFLPLKCII